jgi:hypothetical protein
VRGPSITGFREERVSKLLITGVSMTLAAALLAPVALAVDDVNTQRLRDGVTADGILQHMRALQRRANANEGTRRRPRRAMRPR